MAAGHVAAKRAKKDYTPDSSFGFVDLKNRRRVALSESDSFASFATLREATFCLIFPGFQGKKFSC